MQNVIGVISDTHGLLRPEAVNALRGVDMILHAGDIGGPEILDELGTIAPVVAVRGNNDKGDWARDIPDRRTVEFGSLRISMLHDLKVINQSSEAANARVVVAGHSHRPSVEERAGILYLNPGSAGPRRFSLPITVALLRIGGRVSAEIVHLLTDQTKTP